MEMVIQVERLVVHPETEEVTAESIRELEASMNSSLQQALVLIPAAYEASKFNRQDLFAILEGAAGISSGILGMDPFAALGAAIGVVGRFASMCSLGSLNEILNKTMRWLTFGQQYAALEDSSDLDFDQLDVGAVPEVLQANLEFNKEGLAADLVCMLEERLLPRDRAKLQEQIERFFIAGGARIDLIAKVIDLDNDIGGHNFDIANLQETSDTLQSLSQTAGSPIAESIQQTFLDDLLTSYGQMETSFAKNLYLLYKGFEFRTLWNVIESLAQFERTASEAAPGTGSLQGVLQLTNALQSVNNLQNDAQQCFTHFPFTSGTHRFSFDSVQDATFFNQLHQGDASFVLRLSQYSCSTCYNIRLLQMYIELYGNATQNQTDGFPATVYLKLLRRSGAFFRNGTGGTREFRQPLGQPRTLEFNRFVITNDTECTRQKQMGNSDSLFCLEENDIRLTSMCCHYLSGTDCTELSGSQEECSSPFGTYDISMPIDNTIACNDTNPPITHENCQQFNRTIYTNMNVWIHFLFWAGNYPTGPDDTECGTSFSTPNSKSKVPLTKLPFTIVSEA
ncbi:uncharacterized protein LOC144642907 isoform X2 [Oculina patagonica]